MNHQSKRRRSGRGPWSSMAPSPKLLIDCHRRGQRRRPTSPTHAATPDVTTAATRDATWRALLRVVLSRPPPPPWQLHSGCVRTALLNVCSASCSPHWRVAGACHCPAPERRRETEMDRRHGAEPVIGSADAAQPAQAAPLAALAAPPRSATSLIALLVLPEHFPVHALP